MPNKRFNIQRLKDKLFRHDAMHLFSVAWEQLKTTGEWGPFEANGGWIFGRAL